MSDPLVFDSTTARLSLPLLYSGQAQKEVFVNEALGRVDALMHCIIEAAASTPPATPADGLAWLVGASATGEWQGHDGSIAVRQAGQWLFIAPFDGLRISNRLTGQDSRWISGAWKAPATPALPSGGTVIDVEARQALQALVTKLREAGIFAQ
jgi:hypothetical protein